MLGALEPRLRGAKAKGSSSASAYAANDIRFYGAKGAGEDNTAHINSLLAYCASTGAPALFAGLNLVSSGGHTHDISKFNVEGQGAYVNCTSMMSGNAWTLKSSIPTGSALSVRHTAHSMRNIDFHGGIGVGLYIDSSSSNPAINGFSFYGVGFEYFTTGIQCVRNNYLLEFVSCSVSDCTTGILLSVGANAGEKMTFHGGLVGNCTTGYSNLNVNSDFYFFGTSFDNHTTYLNCAAGKTELIGCHLELNNASSLVNPPIVVFGTSTQLSMLGGYMLADSTLACPTLFTVAAGATISISGHPRFQNCLTTTSSYCSGLGVFDMNGPVFETGPLNYFKGIGPGYSPLIDGNFASASFTDIWSLMTDTATVTNRYSGTNVNLAISNAQPFGASANSLVVTKSGGAGTAASVGVFVAAKGGYRVGVWGFLNGSVSQSYTVRVAAAYGKIQYNANGIPSLQGQVNVGSQNVTPLANSQIPITSISQTNSAVVTSSSSAASNPFVVGQMLAFSGVSGMTQINGTTGFISAIGGSSGAWTATVSINTSSYSAYTSGGSALLWTFFHIMANAIPDGYDTYLITLDLSAVVAGTYYIGGMNVGLK